MKCAGCQRDLKVGDRYIKDTSSGFIKTEGDSEANADVDGIMAMILGGVGNDILFCEDCTTDGGDYYFETVYGDEADVA